jgi:hypothetical protein
MIAGLQARFCHRVADRAALRRFGNRVHTGSRSIARDPRSRAEAVAGARLASRPSMARSHHWLATIVGVLGLAGSAGAEPPRSRSDAASRATWARDPRLAPPCRGWFVRAAYQAEDPRSSMASLVDGAGRASRVRIGDTASGMTLVGMTFDYRHLQPIVWLWDGESLCRAGLERQRPPAPQHAARPTARARRKASPESPPPRAALLAGVRLVPETRSGRVVGARLFGIRPGSLLSALGFQNGDLIRRVNGQAATSMAVALSLYGELATRSDWAFDLERRGELKTLRVTVR